MTDYAIVLLTRFSGAPALRTARDLASASRLPLPTVGKLLKVLCKHRILESVRGVHGGYQLSRAPQDISLAQIVEAFDGPLGITPCSTHTRSCELQGTCSMQPHWRSINEVIVGALSSRSLADLQGPPPV